MKKYFLFAFLVVTLIVSCGKNDIDPVDTNPILKNSFEKLLYEYKILNDSSIFKDYTFDIDSINIYFYGLKDNKLYLKGFNQSTKQNIVSSVSQPEIESTISITGFYGEIFQQKVNSIKIKKIYQKDLYSIFILYFPDFDIIQNSLLSYEFQFTNLVIASQNKMVIHKGNYSNWFDCLMFDIFYPWFDDNVLVYSKDPTDTNLRKEKLFLIKPNGDIIDIFENILPDYYYPVSNEEYINLAMSTDLPSEYRTLQFYRMNLKTNSIIWSKVLMNNFPKYARMDNCIFEAIDKDFTKCTFNYTTYEGVKNVLSVKINNYTGEFVQL